MVNRQPNEQLLESLRELSPLVYRLAHDADSLLPDSGSKSHGCFHMRFCTVRMANKITIWRPPTHIVKQGESHEDAVGMRATLGRHGKRILENNGALANYRRKVHSQELEMKFPAPLGPTTASGGRAAGPIRAGVVGR